jgi:hypothetical protein
VHVNHRSTLTNKRLRGEDACREADPDRKTFPIISAIRKKKWRDATLRLDHFGLCVKLSNMESYVSHSDNENVYEICPPEGAEGADPNTMKEVVS